MKTTSSLFQRVGAALLCLLGASLSFAQVPSQHGRIPPVPREPEYPGTARIPRQPNPTIVLPSEPPEYGEDTTKRSAGVIGRVPAEMPRLPDGYVVANRPASVERQDEFYVLNLQSVPGLPAAPPLRVLPNNQLALLETVLAGRTRMPDLVVTGRVTDFSGVNYVLVESIREGSAPVPAAAPPAAAQQPPPAAAPAPAPAPAAASTEPTREPTAEEVVRRLMQAQPRRALVLPPPQQQPPPAAATRPAEETPRPATRELPRWAEETVLIDRPGRLIPGEPWWTFTFEDLGQSPSQKPIRVLPSQLLETAIGLSKGGTGSVVLVVSGEITVYKGIDYLLLRKVLVRRDLGNFR